MAVNQLIQVRRDTAANWTSVNPTLSAGEIGFETNTGKFKIGTGAAWTSTSYAPAGIGYGTGATITTITGSGGTLTLPASGTIALTTVTNGFLKGDGTVQGGTTLTGNLSVGTYGITTTNGTFTFGSTAGTLAITSDIATNYLSKTNSSSQTMAGPIAMGGNAITGAGAVGVTSLTSSGAVSGTNLTASGTLSVTGTTTLNTSLNGYVVATSGVLSASSTLDISTGVITGTLPVNRGGTNNTSWTGSTSGTGIRFVVTNSDGSALTSQAGLVAANISDQKNIIAGGLQNSTGAGTVTVPSGTYTLALPAKSETVLTTSDIGNAAFKTGSAPSQALNLTGVTTVTAGASGSTYTLTLPTSAGTLAKTDVVNGYVKADGTVTMTGNLNIDSYGILTGSGTLSLPTGTSTLVSLSTGDARYVQSTATGALNMNSNAISGVSALTVTGTTTLATSLSGFVKATSGVISSSASVNLASEVGSTILPVVNGGLGVNSKSTSGSQTLGAGYPALQTARADSLRIFVGDYPNDGAAHTTGIYSTYTAAEGDLVFI